MGNSDLTSLIAGLEGEIGPLSASQRILLGTDGSVTSLLEILTRHPVEVVTLRQEVLPADPATAALLRVPEGEEVNFREVELRDRSSGRTLLYAISHTPLSRLEPGFRSDLMRADIPIGRILRAHRIEARRDILELRVDRAGPDTAGMFGICPGEPLLSRHYHIIHRDRPLISIRESFPACRFTEENRVIVEASSRIHLSLIDLNGSLGRVDGGIGIALSDPSTLLEVRWNDRLSVKGGETASRERVHRVAETLLSDIGQGRGAEITLHRTIPAHVGLGGGTSLSLATAAGLYHLARREAAVPDLARRTGRGGTSGIGTAAFETGGFVLDGGHRFGGEGGKNAFLPSAASGEAGPARVTSRHPFPGDWRILLAIPHLPAGASGDAEKEIFRTACPVPLADVREICHEIVVRLLPGLVEHDLDLFGKAVNRIQEIGFKKEEIGLQDPLIPRLLSALRDGGAACAGMSSFGPTVFAITDTDAIALQAIARECLAVSGGDTFLTTGHNQGARIRRE